MLKIKTAVIGYGLSGRYLQAPFYQSHSGFEVVRIVTSRADEVTADFPGLTPTASAEEVFADPEVDLVSIATPNATHYAIARAALEAGKHVLVDKPACATAAELRELRDLAERKGLHLFVFQNRRWDSDFLTVKQVLASGDLGRLVGFEARYDRWKPQANAKAWKETPGPGAGMIYDLGAHLIDQAIACFGVPNHVSGRTWIQRPFSSIPDAFDLHLEYDGFGADLSCSLLVREPTPRYRLHGDKGSFVKYGIDVQEDQLKAGLRPADSGFGQEPEAQAGILHTDAGRATYPTLTGRWMNLFDNMYEVIAGRASSAIPLRDIIAQLELIETVTG
ncbi:oxidoreductase [Neolewinella aurantiaca]|uniref:Oxidoreductase n=1 Tax=Neolewinella aurantiaca TaxID=2602767 RepID=A0A5C7F7J4_9BACT|nr:Gfo/Idh/MocA family oxidoreductase [Neolewinella aurantiaca]TXF86662.1 oxidoreductase [Neolewinella aurantiaca]